MALRWRIGLRRVWVARVAMADHRAIDDICAVNDVAEPRCPDGTGSSLAEARRQQAQIVGGYCLIENSTIEARASASRLINHESGVIVADSMGEPAFSSVGRRVYDRSC